MSDLFSLPGPLRSSFEIVEDFHRQGAERRTSRFFVTHGPTPPEGLDSLGNVARIFISPVRPEEEKDILESSHLFQLLDTCGSVKLTAIKTFHYENCDQILEIDITILEPTGGGVLSIKGDCENISICTLSFSGTLIDLIGTIHCPQRSKFSSNSRKNPIKLFIRDPAQNDIFVLISTASLETARPKKSVKGNFLVYQPTDLEVSIAKISNSWPNESVCELAARLGKTDLKANDLCGIEFTNNNVTEISNQSRGLLVAALLVIYFQTFGSDQKVRKGVWNFQAIYCALFSCVICTLILFLLTGVIVEGIRELNDWD